MAKRKPTSPKTLLEAHEELRIALMDLQKTIVREARRDWQRVKRILRIGKEAPDAS